MAKGRMSHHWDLFTPLICFVANPYLSKNRQLHADKVHPFKKKKPRWITQEEFKKTLYASRSEYCEEENDNYSKNNRQINDAPKNEYKQT